MKVPDIIKEVSRKLRKNMTVSEQKLWNEIRKKKINNHIFYRQKPILVYKEDSGFDRYIIPDFINLEYKIIIEIDGAIHNKKEIYNLDRFKEKLLKNLGYKILRFTNKQIEDSIDQVLKEIAVSFLYCKGKNSR